MQKLAPDFLKQTDFYQRLSRQRRLWRLQKQIATTQPLKIVIGAGPTKFPGWLETDREILDISRPDDWAKLFQPESIDSILCEHVLEHLSEDDAKMALSQCFRYLKSGALMRLAVPDGYRRDPDYVTEASPPNDGHQLLFNIRSLTEILEQVGFRVTPLEYFDENEEFHAQSWDETEGFVIRSARFDSQEKFRRGDLHYTSVIVDARKP